MAERKKFNELNSVGGLEGNEEFVVVTDTETRKASINQIKTFINSEAIEVDLGNINKSIKPVSDNSYNLGSEEKKWKNIYANTIYEGGESLSEKYSPTLNAGSNITFTSGDDGRTITISSTASSNISVINRLNSDSINSALSAYQGKVLNETKADKEEVPPIRRLDYNQILKTSEIYSDGIKITINWQDGSFEYNQDKKNQRIILLYLDDPNNNGGVTTPLPSDNYYQGGKYIFAAISSKDLDSILGNSGTGTGSTDTTTPPPSSVVKTYVNAYPIFDDYLLYNDVIEATEGNILNNWPPDYNDGDEEYLISAKNDIILVNTYNPSENSILYCYNDGILAAASGGGSSDIIVEDSLESESTDNALSAKQGKVLNEKFSKYYTTDQVDDLLSNISGGSDNTTGSTNDNSSKLFLVGSTAQSSSSITYSNSNCYINNSNLYSNGSEVATISDIVNDLNYSTNNSTKALSAYQGKVLDEKKADKATTLSGYGITNAYTKTEVDTLPIRRLDYNQILYTKTIYSNRGTKRYRIKIDWAGENIRVPDSLDKKDQKIILLYIDYVGDSTPNPNDNYYSKVNSYVFAVISSDDLNKLLVEDEPNSGTINTDSPTYYVNAYPIFDDYLLYNDVIEATEGNILNNWPPDYNDGDEEYLISAKNDIILVNTYNPSKNSILYCYNDGKLTAIGNGGLTVTNSLTSTSTSAALSAYQGKYLYDNKADKATTLSGYGITNAYTKTEVYTKSEVNNLLKNSGGSNITVEDSLTSESTTNALSVNQGKILSDRISALENYHTTTTSTTPATQGSSTTSTPSDATLKNIISDVYLSPEQISSAPSIKFTWKYGGMRENVGTIAQYWKEVLPEVVKGEEGGYSMDYGAASMVSVISLAKKVIEQNSEIQELKMEIEELKALIKNKSN